MSLFIHILLLALTGGGPAQIASVQQTAAMGTALDVDLYGNIYLLDGDKSTLTLLDRTLATVAVIGQPGWDNGRFDRPAAVWARNGIDVFVADYGNHRIQRFDRQLAFVSSLSTRESDNPDVRFGYPTDVALSRLGDLFVCDGENQRVLRINRLSEVERVIGGFDAGEGKLERPTKIGLGPDDDLFVLDGERILVFDAFGNFLARLYDSMWKAPSALYADADRVIVADGGELYCFGPERQLLAQMKPGENPTGAIRGIGSFGGKMYLLGERGLSILPDPFVRKSRD